MTGSPPPHREFSVDTASSEGRGLVSSSKSSTTHATNSGGPNHSDIYIQTEEATLLVRYGQILVCELLFIVDIATVRRITAKTGLMLSVTVKII